MTAAQPAIREDAKALDRMNAIKTIRESLDAYLFKPANEDDLQAQVFGVLIVNPRLQATREVTAARGRYDILVDYRGEVGPVRIVLELKVSGSAASVERQAQRYALTPDIDMVGVVTTSHRLGRRLLEVGGDTLGGKRFFVVVLRAF